jgi:hypothetical protein
MSAVPVPHLVPVGGEITPGALVTSGHGDLGVVRRDHETDPARVIVDWLPHGTPTAPRREILTAATPPQVSDYCAIARKHITEDRNHDVDIAERIHDAAIDRLDAALNAADQNQEAKS